MVKKRNTALLIFYLISILLMGFDLHNKDKFKIEIIQSDKVVEVNNGVVKLDKKPFTIKVFLNNHDGVFMNSSFSRAMYDTPADKEIDGFKWINGRVRVEKNFNEDKELVIQDDIFSFLFYNPEMDWHRFDQDVKKKGKKVIATKKIENLYLASSKKSLKMSEASNEIYLFFIATEKYQRGKAPVELQRYRLKVSWK